MRKDNAQSGFTLIETLVAVAILMLAIAGPLTIATKGLTSSVYSRDQLVASYLAQEAIEFVRNARDENVLKGGASHWMDGAVTGGIPLTDCMGSGSCRIDVYASLPSDWVNPCPGAGCPPLNYNSSAGYYTYGSGDTTPFNRLVTIRDIPSTGEVRVTAIVSWSSGIFSRTIRVEEYLSNWQATIAP